MFELHRYFDAQPSLCILYSAVFMIAYYGMFRVGELSFSQHSIKAANVHMGMNKQKILIILRSSKTHGLESRPQRITITGGGVNSVSIKRHFCPFRILHTYLQLRGDYDFVEDQLFVFTSGLPVKPNHIRTVLTTLLQRLNLDPTLYGVHSFRIGRCTDMFKWGCSLSSIKMAGRW